jgi:dephospho-CoA kinase
MHSIAPFRVVLTGGIASGKNAVADEFAAQGVPVIDTDQLARDVVEPGTPAFKQIIAKFGADILDGTGRLDRRRMRERVFSNPEERKKLEAITHPAIRDELARRSASAHGVYQVHVIPLYVETGRRGSYDRVLVVDCSPELQLQRLIDRDRMNRAAAEKILAAQANREDRLAVADDVIVNDADFEALREQVRRLHVDYLKQAANKV